ncbi:hypothetical protein GWK16_07095 [Roseomonas sp. JC162]|uniref:Alpha/beta hydrolase n=1 Tax=Neoroseomonas marina TaxID=1232220 RepID=A0A848EC10_9PROT|nr:hypothetical protein [Neoroseomonas marina]NMJ41000.1 hypothetical protein [Neoroseomonas marina]
MPRLLRAALAAGCLAAVPAAATEYTRFQPIPYVTTLTGCAGVALMNVPQGWQPGHLAALLLADTTRPDAQRDALLALLLQDGAAVVEVALGAHAACDGERDALLDLAPPEDPLGVVFALLGAARRAGAGPVVAIGVGPGAGVVADAAREDVAARYLPQGAPRFAAAAAVAGPQAAFLLGPPAERRDGAPSRFQRLCGALGGAEGTPVAAQCLAAFARSPEIAEAPR